MHVPGLLFIAFMSSAMLASPFWLAWSVFCLTRRSRRTEGLFVLGFGLGFALFAATVFLGLGLLLHLFDDAALPSFDRFFRIEGIGQFAGYFACGALAGEVHYRLWRLHAVVFRGLRGAFGTLLRALPSRGTSNP